MIVLAGSECPGIHLVEFTALVVKFPVNDRQQHRGRTVLQGLAEAALAVVSASAVFGGFRGAFLQTFSSFCYFFNPKRGVCYLLTHFFRSDLVKPCQISSAKIAKEKTLEAARRVLIRKLCIKNDSGICLNRLANKNGLLFYSSPFFVASFQILD